MSDILFFNLVLVTCAVSQTEHAQYYNHTPQELDVHALETLGLLEAKNEDVSLVAVW